MLTKLLVETATDSVTRGLTCFSTRHFRQRDFSGVAGLGSLGRFDVRLRRILKQQIGAGRGHRPDTDCTQPSKIRRLRLEFGAVVEVLANYFSCEPNTELREERGR